MDLLLDGNFNIAIDAQGNSRLTSPGVAQAAQRLAVRLKHFYGELITDKTFGVPYLEELLGQVADDQTVDQVFRSQCLKDPEVREVERIEIERDGRTLTVRPFVRYLEGTATIEFQVNSEAGKVSLWVDGQPIDLGDAPYLFIEDGIVVVEGGLPLTDI